MDVKMPRAATGHRRGIGDGDRQQARIAPIGVSLRSASAIWSSGRADAGAMAYLVKPFSVTDPIDCPRSRWRSSRFSEIAALEQEISHAAVGPVGDPQAGQARKGLLQTKQGMTEPEAFKWIQRAAMDRRTTMKRVAEVVLETLDTPTDDSPSS